MKKIGFADYYLSEWHANNYPHWIANANTLLGTEYTVAYAWAERDRSPVDGRTSQEWCQEFGVEFCHSLAQLCEKSDAIIMLAPSDPEKHLSYARTVLQYGKPTYIDKTFAPNLAEAQEIFRIARAYNTPFFSTSALRCSEELKELHDVSSLILTGGGSNLPEYIIHLVEMAVMLLEDPVKSVRVEHQGNQRFCHLTTENGKQATLIYAPKLGYAVATEDSLGKARGCTIRSDFFSALLTEILRFFESGTVFFDPAQTLEVMRVRDAILAADTNDLAVYL